MENRKQTEQEMTGTERFVGVWRALLFFLVLFVISSMAHYENNTKERLAHHEVSKRRLQKQILLGKNQMLLAEISKMVRFLPQAINNSSRFPVVDDPVQGLIVLNPDAVDSVPCCGDPLNLPPFVDLKDGSLADTAAHSDVTDIPEGDTVEEVFDNAMVKAINQMPEEVRVKMQNVLHQINAFESSLNEAGHAELEKMKVGLREQFKAQRAMFMPEEDESEVTQEELEARERLMEKTVHFRAVSRLMVKTRMAAIEKKIQEARQTVREHIYTPEEIEQQDAIQAVTDLAFPPNEE